MTFIQSPIKRFVKRLLSAIFILLAANALLLGLYAYYYKKSISDKMLPIPLLKTLSTSLVLDNKQFTLDSITINQLDSQHLWAVLLDDKQGTILWKHNFPEELPSIYTLSDIALLSRYYLKDYPTYTWKHPQGLIVLGFPKNSMTKIIGTISVFEANENYWGRQPRIRKITVKVIPDNQTRVLALEKGEIDLIFGKNMIDADAVNKYLDSEEFQVALSDPTSTRQIVLNTANGVLRDKAVRQALQHATNRQAISDGVFYGLEKPADTLFASTVPYCDIDLKSYGYDTALAESMLEEAGWTMGSGGLREKDGQTMAMSLLYNSDSVTEKTIAEYLQSEYGKLGIKLDIKGEEEQSYRDNMKAGNFDMVFNICWGTPYDPQSSLAAMRQPVYGDYAAQLGLEDKKEIDQAITNILVSTDEAKRQELYTFVLTRLHEDAVYIPLTYECNKAISTSALKGVGFTQTQYEVPFTSMYFE